MLYRIVSWSLKTYSDFDWAGYLDERNSTSGYVLYLGRNPVPWKSVKQKTIAISLTEAEYTKVLRIRLLN